MLIKLFSRWDIIWMIIVEREWLLLMFRYTFIFKVSRHWHVRYSPAVFKLGRLDRNSQRGIELLERRLGGSTRSRLDCLSSSSPVRQRLDLDFCANGSHNSRVDQRNIMTGLWTGMICHDHFGRAN